VRAATSAAQCSRWAASPRSERLRTRLARRRPRRRPPHRVARGTRRFRPTRPALDPVRRAAPRRAASRPPAPRLAAPVGALPVLHRRRLVSAPRPVLRTPPCLHAQNRRAPSRPTGPGQPRRPHRPRPPRPFLLPPLLARPASRCRPCPLGLLGQRHRRAGRRRRTCRRPSLARPRRLRLHLRRPWRPPLRRAHRLRHPHSPQHPRPRAPARAP